MASNTNININIRYRPGTVECPSCTFCTTSGAIECPQTNHPYNVQAHTGMQCYMCSRCSHNRYKAPAKRLFSRTFTWYVHIPLDEEMTGSEILKYRLALAELQNARATIFVKKENVPDGGMVMPVAMAKDVPANVVFAEAREMVRCNLRNLQQLYDMEQFLGV
ncbi:hypothetical protein P175DRAFT_0543280 [Aspergillus ochraceoroseus IBT 24754]|uniref:Uncharacterized protein n=1 Tax=Aspergillus ochraceoroseus IBT 24754 TaxID=1392256 RepID=A0A2T5M3K0_9EURO|nr:uncharacterized protein P175DRAFT_0543280 [Aspergillus ochraceoroseus IBT 24754]PTU23110.1 hypothetical protein P175DRAFT_0543280 [Aspergillus ochraceoroseus IBT 24754]